MKENNYLAKYRLIKTRFLNGANESLINIEKLSDINDELSILHLFVDDNSMDILLELESDYLFYQHLNYAIESLLNFENNNNTFFIHLVTKSIKNKNLFMMLSEFDVIYLEFLTYCRIYNKELYFDKSKRTSEILIDLFEYYLPHY